MYWQMIPKSLLSHFDFSQAMTCNCFEMPSHLQLKGVYSNHESHKKIYLGDYEYRNTLVFSICANVIKTLPHM